MMMIGAPGRSDDAVLGDGEMQMAIEVLLDVFDAGELADLADADLAPFVVAALRSSLVVAALRSLLLGRRRNLPRTRHLIRFGKSRGSSKKISDDRMTRWAGKRGR